MLFLLAGGTLILQEESPEKRLREAEQRRVELETEIKYLRDRLAAVESERVADTLERARDTISQLQGIEDEERQRLISEFTALIRQYK